MLITSAPLPPASEMFLFLQKHVFACYSKTVGPILMFNISNDPSGCKLILGLLCFPEKYIKKVKNFKKQVKMAFFHVFLPVSDYGSGV